MLSETNQPRRRYASTYVVAVLTIAALVLAIVPGDYRVAREKWVHGWPWTYLTREPVLENPASLSPSFGSIRFVPWSLSDDVSHFAVWLLLADVGIGLGITAATCWIWVRWRRRRRQLYQFHIRDLLLLTAVVAVVCAWNVLTRRTCREEQAAAARLKNSSICYQSALPGWLLQWLEPTPGELQKRDYYRGARGPFEYVVAVVPERLWDGDNLEGLRPLSHLEFIYFVDCKVPLQGIEVLKTLPRLSAIAFHQSEVGGEQIKQLAECTNLEYLGLITYEGNLNPGYRSLICSLRSLERLDIHGCGAISEEDLEAIAHLPYLRSLKLTWSRITDAELHHLKSLPFLTTLDLSGTAGVTDAGVEALKHAMPQLRNVTR